MGSVLDLLVMPEWGTHLSSCPKNGKYLAWWHHIPEHSHQHHGRMPHPVTGTVPALQYPRSAGQTSTDEGKVCITSKHVCTLLIPRDTTKGDNALYERTHIKQMQFQA